LQPFLDTDLKFIFPAVDRMPFAVLLNPEGDIESFRVSLTIDQINDRLASENKGAKDKHLEKIQYVPKKAHVIKHQIYKMLSVSLTEIAEIEQITRRLLRTELRAQKGLRFDRRQYKNCSKNLAGLQLRMRSTPALILNWTRLWPSPSPADSRRSWTRE
jgi:hypothetical protein